jgi:hypothetical protein
MAAVDDLVYNPYAFAVHDDPYETYRRLRDETSRPIRRRVASRSRTAGRSIRPRPSSSR